MARKKNKPYLGRTPSELNTQQGLASQGGYSQKVDPSNIPRGYGQTASGVPVAPGGGPVLTGGPTVAGPPAPKPRSKTEILNELEKESPFEIGGDLGGEFGIKTSKKYKKGAEKRASKSLSAESAAQYRQQTIEEIYAQHVQDVETKKQAVTQWKIPPKQGERKMTKLIQRLEEVKKPEVRKKIVSRFEKKYTKKVTTEIPKPVSFRTSEESWRKAMKNMNRTANRIEAGKEYWAPERKEPESGLSKIGDVIGEGVGTLVKGFNRAASSGSNATIPGSTQSLGPNPVVHNLDLSKPAMAAIIEYAERPKDAFMATIAKGADLGLIGLYGVRTPGLIDLGLVTGAEKEAWENAPEPMEAFLSSREDKIEGTALLRGLGGKEAAKWGIVADIFADPLTYAGAAAAPAKVGTKSAMIAKRIEKAGVEAIDADHIALLTKEAANSGDFSRLEKVLGTLAKDNNVSLKRLGLTKDDRAVKKRMKDAETIRVPEDRPTRKVFGKKTRKVNAENPKHQEILDEAKKTREEFIDDALDIGGLNLHVPGKQMADAIAEVAKTVNKGATAPGIEFRINSPLGKRWAGASLRLSENGWLGNFPLPNFRYTQGNKIGSAESPTRQKVINLRKEKAEAEVSTSWAQRVKEAQDNLDEVMGGPPSRATRRKIIEAKARVKQVKESRSAEIKSAKKGISKKGITPFEKHEIKNRQRQVHSINAQANVLDRQTREKFLVQMDAALRVDTKLGKRELSPKEQMRITLFQHSRGDTGGIKRLDEDLGPLTDRELQGMRNLDKVYESFRRHGTETGVLDREVANYVPRQYREEGQQPDLIDELLNESVGAQSTPSFTRARSAAEMASIADPVELAAQLRLLTRDGFDLTPEAALDLANKWHDAGRVRTAAEHIARKIQRGTPVRIDDLTKTEREAVQWFVDKDYEDLRRLSPADGDTLFRVDTDGFVKFINNDQKVEEMGFTPDLYGGLTEQAATERMLATIQQEMDDLSEKLRYVDLDAGLADDYQKMIDNLAKELEDNRIRVREPFTIRREVPNPNAGSGRPEDYATLGLTPPVDPNDVKSAYRRRAREAHPDVGGSEAEFRNVNESYERLRDVVDDTRKHYEETTMEVWRTGAIPEASKDYLEGLRDFREKHSKLAVVLDPRELIFYRASAEARATAYWAKFNAVDKLHGRSMEDVEAGRLVPEGDVFFRDTLTGREYVRAPDSLNKVAKKEDAARAEQLLGLKYKNTRLWPTDVVRDLSMEMHRAGEFMQTDYFEKGALALFQRYLTLTRFGVTTYFPAYHVRNMISDAMQSMLADSGVMFHPLVAANLASTAMFRKSAGKMHIPGYTPMNAEDFLLTADIWGFQSGLHAADLLMLTDRQLLNMNPEDMAKFGAFKNAVSGVKESAKGGFGLGPSRKLGRFAGKMSSRRENIIRFITFRQRLKTNGGDAADAMWHTIRYHFDYGDLTMVERRNIRNLFMFYTWYRKNIPLQFQKLIERPGFFTGINYIYEDTKDGDAPWSRDWSKFNPILPDLSRGVARPGMIPEYMMKLGGISMGWNDASVTMGFGAPFADINTVTNFLQGYEDGGGVAGMMEQATRDFITLSNPLIQLVYSSAASKDALTGREFKQGESSGFAYAVDWLNRTLGGDGIDTDENGRPILPTWVNRLANMIPGAGRGTSALMPINEAEDQGRLQTYASALAWFLGVSVKTVPHETVKGIVPGKNDRTVRGAIDILRGRMYTRSGLYEKLSNIKAKYRTAKDGTVLRIPPPEIKKFDMETLRIINDPTQRDIMRPLAKAFGAALHPKFRKIDEADDDPIYNVDPSSFSLDMVDPFSDTDTKPERPPKDDYEEINKQLNDKGEEDDGDILQLDALGFNIPLPSIDLDLGLGGGGTPATDAEYSRITNRAIDIQEGKFTTPKKEQVVETGNKKARATVQNEDGGGWGSFNLRTKKNYSRKQQVKLAKRILKAKASYNAAKSGRVTVADDTYDAQVATRIMNRAMSKHNLTKVAAAGLVGNAIQESSLNPASGANSANGGLFGFTSGEVGWGPVQETISAQGKDPLTDVEAQVDYALTHGYATEAISAMNAAKTPEDAAAQFMLIWERPADQSASAQARRGQNARTIFDSAKSHPTGKAEVAKSKKKWHALVKLGKAVGVYEVPDKQAKINTIPEAGPGKGDWGGMEYILQKAATGFDVSSTKRSASDPLSLENPGSDHNEANSNVYAVDLPATGEAGRQIAETMHTRLGLNEPLETGTFNWYTSSKYPDTRFQVLWEVEGHYDHVHVGGENTANGGNITIGPISPMQQVKAARAAAAASTTTGTTTGGTYTSPGGGIVSVDQTAGPAEKSLTPAQDALAADDALKTELEDSGLGLSEAIKIRESTVGPSLGLKEEIEKLLQMR